MSLHNCLKRDVIKLRLFFGANKKLNMKEKEELSSSESKDARTFVGRNISKFISNKNPPDYPVLLKK